MPETERECPRCGAGYVPFGEECCERIDWQVRLVRVLIHRRTYRRGCRCQVRDVLAAPPAPKPIAKGRFTTQFLARLLVEKFVAGPCSVPKLSRGPANWRFSAAQAIRWYSLITPPRTRCRRIGALSGMTHAGSWLGGR